VVSYDTGIAEPAGICTQAVDRVRERYAGGGLEAALHYKAQENRKVRVLDGAAEAYLIALACSAPPRSEYVSLRWSMS
jgi:hypothetical protein